MFLLDWTHFTKRMDDLYEQLGVTLSNARSYAKQGATLQVVLDNLEAQAWVRVAGETGFVLHEPAEVFRSTFQYTHEYHDGYCSDQDFETHPDARRQRCHEAVVWSKEPPALGAHAAWEWFQDTHTVCGCTAARAVLVTCVSVPWIDAVDALTNTPPS